MRFHLGVIDIIYEYGDDPGKTTHEVAKELEERYKLFTNFFNMYQEVIVDEVGSELAYSIINHIEHGVEANEILSLDEIKLSFNRFLENQELDFMQKGVPTGASLRGVNSRLKIETGIPRPSFIDGGLLKTSFQAWMEK